MPQRSLLAHLRNSRHRKRLCDWKVVEGSELIPQLPPATHISVRYVEDFVACFVFTQSPQSRAPEQLCVCCLLKSIPSLLCARKAQGQPEFAAHRSIGRKTGNQVHWRVYAWSHDQMGTQDGPADSVRSRPFSHNVFLRVVVDRRDQTWPCLLRPTVERPNTATVPLATSTMSHLLTMPLYSGST